MKSESKIIDISLIRRPAYPDRHEIDAGGISELVSSMDSIGLLHAIAVKPLDDGYELISGDRRLSAAMILEWTQIWCTIHYNLAAVDVCIMRAQENLQRQNLSPIEEAYSVQRIHTDHQMTLHDIGLHFGRSLNWVTSRLALCDISESLRNSVHNRSLPISHAIALSSVDDDVTRESMHDLCRSEGATLSVLLGWIKDYKRDIMGEIVYTEDNPGPRVSEPSAPPTVICTICGELESLHRLVWKPICENCITAAGS